MRPFLILLVVAGCATAGSKPAQLVKAETAFENAKAGPAAQLAQPQLHSAAEALAAAQKSYERSGDASRTIDLAYIAERKVQLAEAWTRTQQQQQCLASSQNAISLAQQQKAMAMQQQLAQAQNELKQRKLAEVAKQTNVVVREEARGTVITLPGGVLFASGKTTLTPSAQTTLKTVADALREGRADKHIAIEGHTDSVGSEAFNQQLSLERAMAVQRYLVSNGVPQEQIEVKGYGETRPLVDNSTAENRANNRRVEIIVSAPKPVS